MTITLALTRQLPFPPLEINGTPLDVVVIESPEGLSDSTRVICSTALDLVDAKFIEGLPESVGLIANLGVGTDNIDLEAAQKRDIQVSNTPVVTEDTADLAFALLLSTARRIGENERFIRSDLWPKPGASPLIGARVHGKTIGLVGFGEIGQAVARRATGFGMEIRYWNRSAKLDAEKTLNATQVESLNEILEISDFISVHTPLTEDTHHLISTPQLQSCKPGAILINTSRGSVIDEEALVEALRARQLAGAGLDVFENEPKIHEGLLNLENVVLAPHIGSATSECRMDVFARGVANIMSFLRTGNCLDPVTTQA